MRREVIFSEDGERKLRNRALWNAAVSIPKEALRFLATKTFKVEFNGTRYEIPYLLSPWLVPGAINNEMISKPTFEVVKMVVSPIPIAAHLVDDTARFVGRSLLDQKRVLIDQHHGYHYLLRIARGVNGVLSFTYGLLRPFVEPLEPAIGALAEGLEPYPRGIAGLGPIVSRGASNVAKAVVGKIGSVLGSGFGSTTDLMKAVVNGLRTGGSFLVDKLGELKQAVGSRIGRTLFGYMVRANSKGRKILDVIIKQVPLVATLLLVVGLVALVKFTVTLRLNQLEFSAVFNGPEILHHRLHPYHAQIMAPPFSNMPGGIQTHPSANYQAQPPPYHAPSTCIRFQTNRTELYGLPPLVACTQLVSYLRQFAYLKGRDLDLFETLRRKAISWCQSHEVRPHGIEVILLGSIVLAMIPTDEEKTAEVLMANQGVYSFLPGYEFTHRLFSFFRL